jgi:hypothetical protein
MLSALPVAYVAHAGAGRTRLRVPARQGDAGFFSACAARLAELEGVHAVRPRALTAGLLVEHEGGFEAIAEQASAAGLFRLGEPELEGDAQPALPIAAGVLGALAVLQVFRRQLLPPAITLLWYAAALARPSQEPSASTASVRSQGRSRSRRPT